MRCEVKLLANSSRNQIDEIEPGNLIVKVTAPAVENKANHKMVELLSKYFNVSKGRISIIKGLKNKHKVIDIQEA